MANDSIFLVCRGCRSVRKIYKYFGYATPNAYVTEEDLGAFMGEHLYHHQEGGGACDGFHLSEPAPFEVLTDHALMKPEQEAETFALRAAWRKTTEWLPDWPCPRCGAMRWDDRPPELTEGDLVACQACGFSGRRDSLERP